MNRRIDPLGLLNPAPKKTEAKAGKPAQETAAMSNDVPGQCPVCRTNMVRVLVKDIPCYWCQAHNVILPVED